MAGGALLLIAATFWLARILATSVVQRLPLTPTSTLRLAAPGRFTLYLEAPDLQRRPRGLELELLDRSMGGRIELSPVRVPSRIRGTRRTRLSLSTFETHHTGELELVARGLDTLAHASEHALLVTRPVGGRIFASILGIVIGACILLFGLLSFLLLP